jgi:membrane protease YdiL (CAAX protease family)
MNADYAARKGVPCEARPVGHGRRQLTVFFLLAFVLTWLLLVPQALSAHGVLPFELPGALFIVVGYLPALAAVLVARASGGRAEVHELLRRLLVWRVGAGWYGVAVLGFPVVFLASFAVYHLPGGTRPTPIDGSLGLPLGYLLNLVVLGLLNGEEIAWRGFALPALQRRYSALTASLILGPIEALFHAPLFLTPGQPQSHIPPLGFLGLSIADAILFTWLFNNTGGSLLLVYLFHAAQNASTNVLPVADNGPLFMSTIGLLMVLAIVVVVASGSRHLSRSNFRQGFDPGAGGGDDEALVGDADA